MMYEKFSVFLEKQNRRLKILGIYTVLVLLIFSILVPFIGRAGKQEQETAKEEPVTTEIAETVTVLPEAAELVLSEEAELAVPSQTADDAAQAKVEPTTVKSTTVKPAVTQPTNKTTTVAAIAKAADITKIIWPIKGKIIREFGLTYSLTFSDYRNHSAIDIEAKRNTEAVAVLPGKVLSKDITKSAATTVIIEHGNGWRSEYAHLEEVRLKPGDIVVAGQAVGIIGQPGINEILEGPHLHFGLLKDGKAINPLNYLHE